MPILSLVAVVISFFLAMNIGASNSAAEMSAAYGAGVRTKKQAVALIAIFALLGALTVGDKVIKTLGKGLIPEGIFIHSFAAVFIVLLVTTIFIFFANIFRSPIATTHAIVCSVIGIGLYYGQLNGAKVRYIITWWVATPIISFILNYLVGKYLYFRILDFLARFGSEERIKKILGVLITASGCYMAFSAGTNNAANSVGAIVGANIVSPLTGAVMAGMGMGLGAILFGGRIMEAVGKGITEIGIVRAIFVETIGATLIFVASLMGIPVSLNETVTSGIIALSCASRGFRKTARNEHVMRIAFFWLVAPFLAVAISYLLAKWIM